MSQSSIVVQELENISVNLLITIVVTFLHCDESGHSTLF